MKRTQEPSGLYILAIPLGFMLPVMLAPLLRPLAAPFIGEPSVVNNFVCFVLSLVPVVLHGLLVYAFPVWATNKLGLRVPAEDDASPHWVSWPYMIFALLSGLVSMQYSLGGTPGSPWLVKAGPVKLAVIWGQYLLLVVGAGHLFEVFTGIPDGIAREMKSFGDFLKKKISLKRDPKG